jgi:hypothetical protein
MVARPKLGYIRQVHTPCCKRCAVLAGKFFKWNKGFLRHPGCKCVHRPTTAKDAEGLVSDITPDQIRDLHLAQRAAIADGADMNQVINAERGLLNSLQTTEGTTRRGWASYVKRAADREKGASTLETVQRARGGSRNVTRTGPRLTPEAIYRFAGSREEAVRMLAANGYIVGDLKEIARLSLP